VKKIRLLIVDDHPVVQAGLKTLLGIHSDMEVVGEAVDGEMAIKRALELEPDVVVMDIAMAGMNGVEATRKIKELLPETKVLVLTMHDNEEYLRMMLDVGATGYVLKKAANTELAVAIRAVHRGEIFVYPSFTRVLLGDRLQDNESVSHSDQDTGERLSEREMQVLRLIAEGYTNRQIAEKLFLSVRTIETYRARLMEKLQVKSRVGLVRYAIRNQLLDSAENDSMITD
jgi:two-component system, NarL family, response regulator NreC